MNFFQVVKIKNGIFSKHDQCKVHNPQNGNLLCFSGFPRKMPDACVYIIMFDQEKDISLHLIPFYGAADDPQKKQRRKKWVA